MMRLGIVALQLVCVALAIAALQSAGWLGWIP